MSKHTMKRDLRVEEVDNPLTTYAQTVYDEERGVARPGKINVVVNQRTTLGGFVNFRGTPLQNQTVKRFKAIFEAAQIGGARACDPAREPVDGGGVRQEAVTAFGADARRQYGEVRKFLGPLDTARLEYVVIGEWGPTAYAKWRSGAKKANSRQISAYTLELRVIVLRLAKFWNLAGSVNGSRKGREWSDGTRAKLPSALDDPA